MGVVRLHILSSSSEIIFFYVRPSSRLYTHTHSQSVRPPDDLSFETSSALRIRSDFIFPPWAVYSNMQIFLSVSGCLYLDVFSKFPPFSATVIGGQGLLLPIFYV